MILGFLIPLAYLIGSISSAIIVCRLMGLPDPREQGSGNPGATNVMRIGGKKAAAITLVGDLFKGFLPVLIAQLIGSPSILIALTGLAAFAGHLYPIFFGFKGGKGVATLAGILLGFSPLLGAAFMLTWTAIYKIGKISSFAALTTAILAPIYAWFLTEDIALVIPILMMTTVLLWRHKDNIRRLIAKEEH
jgi:glycerol-3-phosphate acyltransferase PlsY